MSESEKSLATIPESRLAPMRELKQEDLVDRSIPTFHRAMVLRSPEAEKVALALAEISGRPMSDRILVLPLPADERVGTIIIPETSREEQCCGIVVSVGRGHYENGLLVAPEVEPGNFVVFSKYSGRELFVGDIKLVQIVEGDITFAAGKNDPR